MALCIWIYYLFIKLHYFKPIENCYIKIHHEYFNDFNIVFKTGRRWKTYFLQVSFF